MIWLNDNEPSCAAALRQLHDDGLIGECAIDERDMRDIDPSTLSRASRYHLCAGIGGFELACRLAGWRDGDSLLTAGFPCQPFSHAGRRGGTGDDRYLWPDVHRFIAFLRPRFVLLENSTGLDDEAHLVLDVVQDDLERVGYEVPPALEIPACGVGAPHIRSRFWIAAHMHGNERGAAQRQSDTGADGRDDTGGRGPVGLADGYPPRQQVGQGRGAKPQQPRVGAACDGGELVDGARIGRREGRAEHEFRGGRETVAGASFKRGAGGPEHPASEQAGRAGQPRENFWSSHEWIACRDEKHGTVWRPAKSGLHVLAHGIPARVDRIRGSGNAIVPQVAAEVLETMMEAR